MNKDEAGDKIFREVVPAKITECSLVAPGKTVCVTSAVASSIAGHLSIPAGPPEEILEGAKSRTGCKTQKCILEKLASKDPEIARELKTNVKVVGPTSTELLSNMGVDVIMHQWATAIPGFHAYNFNMLNYAQYSWRNGRTVESPDTLATTKMDELVSRGVTTAGCIINSDVYQGNGKHWMALFVDARGKEGERWTVEFFNSSGNAPAPEWVNWMVKTRGELERLHTPVEIITVTGLRQQYSKTECGTYSLFYIWARLQGIPAETIKTTRIPDKNMFEFRQHLYVDGSGQIPREDFDWERFQKEASVRWEAVHHDR